MRFLLNTIFIKQNKKKHDFNYFFFHIKGQILVRELWIGNLPNDCNQAILKKNLEIYGEIDNIDFFPKVN